MKLNTSQALNPEPNLPESEMRSLLAEKETITERLKEIRRALRKANLPVMCTHPEHAMTLLKGTSSKGRKKKEIDPRQLQLPV